MLLILYSSTQLSLKQTTWQQDFGNLATISFQSLNSLLPSETGAIQATQNSGSYSETDCLSCSLEISLYEEK